MELDKRILPDKKPLTCLDAEQAKQFIGKECYLSDFACKYENLNDIERSNGGNYIKDVLAYIHNGGQELAFMNNKDKSNFRYCLPAEWVKKPEKKYRSFTLNEFLVTFPMLTDITMREKGDNDCIVTCTVTAYRTRIMSTDICLGVEWISLKELFDKCEYKNTLGDWIPFGEEIEE